MEHKFSTSTHFTYYILLKNSFVSQPTIESKYSISMSFAIFMKANVAGVVFISCFSEAVWQIVFEISFVCYFILAINRSLTMFVVSSELPLIKISSLDVGYATISESVHNFKIQRVASFQ